MKIVLAHPVILKAEWIFDFKGFAKVFAKTERTQKVMNCILSTANPRRMLILRLLI